MKILVTGAGGFLASKLALRLAEGGKQVRALVRTKRSALLQHPNIEIVQGDILDVKSLENAVAGCSQVYHCAALANNWARDPRSFYKVNVEGTRNIAEISSKHGVKKMVATSTAGTIGPAHGPAHAHEGILKPAELYSGYERSKYESEQYLFHKAAEGLPVSIVNPTRVFGPGEMSKSNSVTRIIHRYIRGDWRFKPGTGAEIGNYAYVDDVVKGHILAMEKGKSGERYLLGGENISFDGFLDAVAEVSGKKHSLTAVPLWVFQSYAAVGELLGNFGIEPKITRSWVRKYRANWSSTSAKAERELGYQRTPLKEAITLTVQWLRSKKG